MFRKKINISLSIILTGSALILSACSSTPAPNAERNNNSNPTPVISNSSVPANLSNVATPTVGNKTSPNVVITKKTLPAANEPTPVIGNGGNDFALFTDLKRALSSDKEFIDGVILEVKDGNVTLTGNVSNQNQKIKAAQLVQSVKGVKSVKNNLAASK